MARKQKRQPVDFLTFFEHIGNHAFASDTDRYRDFNKVFLEGGSTAEQGLRVLNEILGWCGLMASPARLRPDGMVGIEATFVRIGKQDIGRAIYDVLTRLPQAGPLPEKTESKQPE